MSTTPINLPASRLEQDDTLAQVRDLERRINELEDRVYAKPVVSSLGATSVGGEVYLNANGLNIISKTKVTVGSWQPDGDIFFGTNVNNPPTGVTIGIFNAAQTYNSESMGVGDMLFGNNSTDKPNMLWDASDGSLLFRTGVTNRIRLGANDVKLGADISAVATTSFVIFIKDTTYNSESLGSGDVLFGDNSSSKANMLWDKSAGILYFRGGTTPKVYINTDGDFYAASGKIRLNANGIEVRNDSDTRYIKLYNTGITTYTNAVGYMNIDKTDPNGNTYGTTVLGIEHDANNQSNVYCWLNEVDIIIKKAGNWRYVIEANYDQVNFNAPIRFTDFNANPSDPADSTIINHYQKGSKIIYQYNDGGTIRYKYLDMAGTGSSWVHTTSAP